MPPRTSGRSARRTTPSRRSRGCAKRLHAAERERDALTAQTAALGRALDVRNAAADLVASGAEGIRGLVGDSVKVTAGYEAAIAAALGSLAEGLLVDDGRAAFAAAHAAREGDLGVVRSRSPTPRTRVPAR